VVSYLVQAAEPLELRQKKWWFPVVGKVPYIGFFEEKERDAMAQELREEGFDVYTSGVGAFSSLGWFDDPIYNSMLNRSHEQLAHLLFHELTHRTFWLAGEVRFNENLAEYVAKHLTLKYLRYHGLTQRLTQYEVRARDKELFRQWLDDVKTVLENLYKNPAGLERKELLRQKSLVFARFTSNAKPAFEKYDYLQGKPWNNARVLAARLYAPKHEEFARAHKCTGESIKVFLESLEESSEMIEDTTKLLPFLCSSPP
jgi:predicted aminopeptidase